jgi:hypothetical protein
MGILAVFQVESDLQKDLILYHAVPLALSILFMDICLPKFWRAIAARMLTAGWIIWVGLGYLNLATRHAMNPSSRPDPAPMMLIVLLVGLAAIWGHMVIQEVPPGEQENR